MIGPVLVALMLLQGQGRGGSRTPVLPPRTPPVKSDSGSINAPPPKKGMPAVLHPGALADYGARLRVACPRASTDRNALLQAELRQGQVASAKGAAASDWLALACTRALLDAAGAIGREGVEMPLGASWAQGAMNAAIKALRLRPDNGAAAEVLGLASLNTAEPAALVGVFASLQGAITAGNSSAAALRACSEFALRLNDSITGLTCANRGLNAGKDSTWHLLRLARWEFRRADALEGARDFWAALGAARGPDAKAEFNWHMQWFVSPEELDQWEVLPDSARTHWAQSRLTARDIRDGRPVGARIAEHFRRLEYVLTHFRLAVPQSIRAHGGLGVATPDLYVFGDPDDPLYVNCEPGKVPARPWRFYPRWQVDFDDRGVIWMRFGEPDKRIESNPACPADMDPPPIVREVWRYDIDGQSLLLNFEGEKFDGSVEATRLVTGVLGSYLCDVDVYRCNLTEKSKFAAFMGVPKYDSPLHPEDVDRARREDQKFIDLATSKDDNSPRGQKNIETVAQFLRVWNPSDGSAIAVVPYAIKVSDLATADQGATRLASVDFAVRQWDPRDGASTTTFTRRMSFTDSAAGKAHLSGYAVVAASPDVTAWSLFVEQSDHRMGRAFEDAKAPLATGHLVLSDLVLGAESQGVAWDRDRQKVFLAPLGAMTTKDAAHLYYQVRSDSARTAVKTTIVLTRTDQGPKGLKTPALQIAFVADLRKGLSEVERQLDVSRLDGGSYRLDVVMTDRSGAVTARQSAMLLLK